VVDNADVEFTEDFTVALSNLVGATAPSTMTMAGTITDDDTAAVSVSNATPLPEGGVAGRTSHVFTISLDRASVFPVSVHWATANGTASAKGDYTAASGNVVLAPGTTSATVSVVVLGDTAREADETFAVNISSPTNALLGTATATGTILDDDVPPTVSVNDVDVVEGNSGTTAATFTVSLSRAPFVATSVQVDLVGSSLLPKATILNDVKMTRLRVTFAPGQRTATVTALVTGDTVKEGNEKFNIRLSIPTGATLGKPIGVGTILNDD
jgi:Calx-beta domain